MPELLRDQLTVHPVVAGEMPPLQSPGETALGLLGRKENRKIFHYEKQVCLTQVMFAVCFFFFPKDEVSMKKNMKLWLVVTAHV